MKLPDFLATLTLLVMSLNICAQAPTLTGKILDRSDNTPMEEANIVVKTQSGQAVQAATTGKDGVFTLNGLQNGQTYVLSISFVGYETLEKSVTINNGTQNTGTLFLVKKPSEIGEVSVTGKVPLAVQNGDTVEYNSDAYKTNPDAQAEDLVKKMPGVEVDNGTVKAQGEQVNKVTVDGRPFFDQDPTLALRSLPASVVEKIQIFDEQSDQSRFTGFDDGETTKTMNIVTRRSMRNGSFGKLYAGYGTDNRYMAGGSVNLFKGTHRISLIGMANNINQQNFSTEDILGMMSGGSRRGGGFRGGGGGGGRRGGGGYRGGGGMATGGFASRNNFMIGQQPGISQTQALGLNYSDTWGKKINVTGSYFVNHASNSNDQEIVQNYFTTETGKPYYSEQNNSSADNLNHRLNMRLTYTIDSSNSILFIPRLSFQKNNSASVISSRSYQDTTLLNQTDNALHSDFSGYNFSNELLYRHRFAKQGRSLSLNINGSMNDNSGHSRQNSQSTFYTDTSSSEVLDQYSRSATSGSSYSTRLAYTEPLGKKSMLMITAGNSGSWNDADKQTFNFDASASDYSLRDTALSSVYKSKYSTGEAGTNYRYRNDKFSLMAGVSYQVAQLKSDEQFPAEDQIKHSFTSILPQAMLRYDISKSKNLRLFYRTSTNSPSISQLQNVIDNSNPVQLSAGNPDLKQTYQHSVFLRYSSVNTPKASAFFILVGGGLGSDYVVNSIFLADRDTVLANGIELKPGTQFVKPVNANGYRNMRVFASYGIPISHIKTNLNLNTSWNYTRSPGVINNVTSYTDNHNFSLGMVLASNISENVDFTVSSASNYSLAKNSVRQEMNNTYFYQKSEINLNLIFWKGLTFSNQLLHQYYSGLSQNFNESYLLWNIGIGKKVFKDKLGEIKLSVFDLLNQNKSISRNVTELYIEDTKTQVLRQYVMLSFTYNLRRFNMQGEPGQGGYGNRNR